MMNKYMGLDVGDATIGIAFSDDLLITAQGFETYRRISKTDDIKYLVNLILAKNVDVVVIGIPYKMSGEINESSEKIMAFAKALSKKLKYSDKVSREVVIDYMDERLTTKQMERIMLMQDASRKERAKNIDKLCAQLILQTYMDINL